VLMYAHNILDGVGESENNLDSAFSKASGINYFIFQGQALELCELHTQSCSQTIFYHKQSCERPLLRQFVEKIVFRGGSDLQRERSWSLEQFYLLLNFPLPVVKLSRTSRCLQDS